MGEYKNKSYPLRISNSLRLKVEYIAQKEDRKLSQQYERIVRQFVAEYEQVNGEIEINE